MSTETTHAPQPDAPPVAPVERADPMLLSLHQKAVAAVTQAQATAQFIAREIAATYQLQPGDEITDDGVIVRAQAAA